MLTFRRLFALLALLCAGASPAFAQSFTYSVYVDSDNNTATGCTVTLASGSIVGAETVLTATVAVGAPPQVTSVTQSNCAGASFGAPFAAGSGAITVGAGVGGSTSIELSNSLAALAGANPNTLRLYVVARSATGEDVLLTTTGAAGGAPILLAIAQPQPSVPAPLIGIPALLLLGGVLLAIGSRATRRRLVKRVLVGLVLVSGIAGAAIFNWTGFSPLATDPAGDTTSGENQIDLLAFFAANNAGNLYFRCDVAGSLTLPPSAVADAYTATWNTTLNTPAPGVLANDTVNGAAISAHSNPAHGALVLNADGSFAYTPTTSYTGADSFTYTLTNAAASSTATVSLNVVAAPLAVADNYSTSVGTALNVSAPGVLANDQLGAPVATLVSFGGGDLGGSVTTNAAGSGVALAGGTITLNADGSINLTAPTTPGTFTFQYRLTNSQGSADGTVTIQVKQAPAITSGATAAFVLNSAGSFTITTTGTPTVTSITLTGCALPAGLTFTYTSGASATIAGSASASGTVSCTVTASNGVAPDATQTLSVSVSQAPVAAADNYSVTVGSALNVAAPGVLGNDQLGAPAGTLTSFGGGDLGGAVTTNAAGASVALAGGTLTVAANGSLGLTAPTTPGTYTFQYRVGNSQGNSDGTVTIQVNQAPAITSVGPATFTLNAPGTYTVTTTGTPTVTAITLTGCALPTGLSFSYVSGANATISGTPTVGGTVSCTVTASNGIAPAATQTLSVSVSQAPTAVADSYTTTVGTALTVAAPGVLQNDALGFPAATLTSFGGGSLGGTVTTNAAGATIALAGGNLTVNANGSVSLTAPTTAGTYTFLYRITNAQGTSDGGVTIQVNQAPAFLTPNGVTFAVGALQTFTITTSGTPVVNSIALSGCTLPAGLSFAYTSGASATISGTPSAGGVVVCTLTASNGIVPDATQTLTVTVNQGPAAVADSYSTTIGTDINIAAPGVLTNDTLGTPAATVTFFGGNSLGGAVTGHAAGTSAALAGGTLTVNANGSLTLTGATLAGEYTFLYRIDNTISTADALVTLDLNQAPAITSAASATFVDNQANTFTVTTSGFPKPALSETGALPAGVTFLDNGDGTATLAGTPTAPGTFALTLTASNGIGSNATQAFTLQVNEAPLITSANATTFVVGTAGTFTATATGTPAPTFSETGALPSGVTFVGGVLSGTPAAGTGGTYPITITASNGVGSNATQPFTLTVNEAPSITSVATKTFVVGTAGTFSVTTTGFPSGASMAISETGALPGGITFVNNNNGTATLSGTAAAGTGGSYPITITASNGIGSNATQSFTIQVNEAPAITSANATTFTVGAPGTFTVTGTGTPAPTFSETGALPAGVTFVGGVLSGTPGAGTGGTYPLTITASNGVGSNATQAFVLTVNQAPKITSANNTTVQVGTPLNFAVTSTGFPAPTISESANPDALPTGVSFGSSAFSGTPGAGTAGTYVFKLTASNGVIPDDNQTFTLSVTCPVITIGLAANSTFTTNYAAPMTLGFAPSGGTAPYTFTLGGTALPGVGVVGNGLQGTPTNTGSFAYTVKATDAFGCSSAVQNNTLVVKPVVTADTYPETVTGNVSINSAGVAGGPYAVTGNDQFPAGATISAFDATSVHGGTIVMQTSGAALGQFTYNPPAGYIGGDSFTYTLSSNGQTATGTVSLTISNMLWFINNAGGAGDGRLSSPFNSTAAFQAVNDGAALHPAANQTIFVYESATAYGAPVTLLSGQKLIGQDATATLATISGITPSASSAALPIMNAANGTFAQLTSAGNTLTLSTGNTVRGLTLATTGFGAALFGTNFAGLTASEVRASGAACNAAVNLQSAAAAAIDATFNSVAATGCVSGIILSNTTGDFNVLGSGANDASGGLITNASSAGVSLSNVAAVSLRSMKIQNTQRSGVNGTLVNGFSFVNGTIDNSGIAGGVGATWSNIAFNTNPTTANNISGTLTVTGSILTNAFFSAIDVQSGSGTLANAVIQNNTITSSTSAASSLGQGVNFVGVGSAGATFSLTKATISGNTITNFPSGAGVQVSIGNANAAGPGATAGVSSANPISITGNFIHGQSQAVPMNTSAIIVAATGANAASRATVNFDVSNNGTAGNPLGNTAGTVILLGCNGFTDMLGSANNNVIVANHTPDFLGANGIAGGAGVTGVGASTPNCNFTVTGNAISKTDGNGILLVARSSGSSTTKFKIQNNTVGAPVDTTVARYGIRVDSGNGSSVNETLCLNVSGNTSAGSSDGVNIASGIGLRKQGTVATTNAFGINALPGGSTATPNVENYVNSLNPASAVGNFGVGGTTLISATSGFSTCSLP